MKLSILFLLFPFACLSQQTINADQFFALGLPGFEQIEAPVREVVNFPLIEKYEFRTETRDFNLQDQEYSFRISPSTPRIRRAQSAYYDGLINAPDFEGQEMYCDFLLSLHADWLSLYIINEKINVLNELAVILSDKQTIYERMVGIYDIDVQDLVKLQTEKSDIDISLNMLIQEQDYLLNKYNIQHPEFDFSNFITVETVSDYLEASLPSLNENEMVDLENEYRAQLLMQEIELETSENRRVIDFVQFKYNGPHSDALQERVSIGLGFQISTSGSDKLKMQELQIEQEELNRKSERMLLEKQEKLRTLENGLQSAIQTFFYFQEIMQNERTLLQGMIQDIPRTEDASLLLLLDVEERYHSMNIKSLNKLEDLLGDYLKHLKLSGKMCQSAFVNYLAQ